MKVAVLSPVAWRTPPTGYGPWELVASNITEGLVKAGVDVTLFATADSVTSAELNSVIDQGYEVLKGQDAKVLECLHISNLMEKAGEFDIIHNHFDFLPLTYSKLIKTPMITTIHGFSSKLIIPVYKKYNANTNYVSISFADRSTELNYLANIYHGVSTEDFRFNDSPGDYLLYFGRIHPDKGTADAITIAKKSGHKLIIAGIIQDEKYFKEHVEPFFEERVEYVGPAHGDRRRELLAGAKALLHPIYFDEPFGLSVAEAMLCGTPVIAYNRGSMPELIEDKRTGFLVNAIDEACESVSGISSIDRHYCHEYAKSRFSIDKMTSDYLDAYRMVLKSTISG